MLLSSINVKELCKTATLLNQNKSCKFVPGKYSGVDAQMGCANYHCMIEFEDAEQWIFRTPRTPFSDIPGDLIEYLVESEYSTLIFLETTNVPAPRAFCRGLASDPTNSVGVNFILMTAVPGRPYASRNADADQQKHVLSQIAGILVEISKHPFRFCGSLAMNSGQIVVSQVASDRFIKLGRHGPYETPDAYFTGVVERHLDLIADGQEYTEYPQEAYLFYQTLGKYAIPSLAAYDRSGNSYLKHVDDKGDHIFVDEDYNITGVIDWQFARVVPACEAFGPSLVTANLKSLYEGAPNLSDGDRLVGEEFISRAESIDYGRELVTDDTARRLAFGLASGLTRDEVWLALRNLLRYQGIECGDLRSWLRIAWEGLGDSIHRQKIDDYLQSMGDTNY